MKGLKILIIILIAFGQSAFYGSIRSASNDCELKVEIQINNSVGGNNNGSAVISPKSGVAPYRYVFLERSSGKLLSKNYSQKRLDKLKKGNYKCLVIDEKGCSKQVEFEIL